MNRVVVSRKRKSISRGKSVYLVLRNIVCVTALGQVDLLIRNSSFWMFRNFTITNLVISSLPFLITLKLIIDSVKIMKDDVNRGNIKR